ncbi:MAG: hypothetical protein QUS07_02235, partial [Methanothrix sp.]|nr:hypothetical protein [Methanothrix sp.]
MLPAETKSSLVIIAGVLICLSNNSFPMRAGPSRLKTSKYLVIVHLKCLPADASSLMVKLALGFAS